MLFEKLKSICIFMLLFYFEFFCNCQHKLFMKMWIMTVFAKKKKKKIVDLWKGTNFCYTFGILFIIVIFIFKVSCSFMVSLFICLFTYLFVPIMSCNCSSRATITMCFTIWRKQHSRLNISMITRHSKHSRYGRQGLSTTSLADLCSLCWASSH